MRHVAAGVLMLLLISSDVEALRGQSSAQVGGRLRRFQAQSPAGLSKGDHHSQPADTDTLHGRSLLVTGHRCESQPSAAINLTGVLVDGLFTYGTNSGNLFDPTVVTSVTHPSQFGNSQANSPQGIPVTAGVEFGWEAFYNFSSETNGPYVFEMTVTTSVDISPTGVITWETRAVSKTTGGLSFSIDVSVRNTTIDLSSVDFVGCTLQNLTDNYIGTPAAARLSSPGTIGIARTLTRYYLSTATPNATYYATWQLSDCPTKRLTYCSSGDCCDLTAQTLKPRGCPCRAPHSHSVRQCQEAVCDGSSAHCPANSYAPVPDGVYCPWRPNVASPYETNPAAAVTASQPDLVPAQQAAAWRTGQPDYDVTWPECPGQCIKGACALRWDHPACCYVRQHQRRHDDEHDRRDFSLSPYDALEVSNTTEVALSWWVSRGWYCWH